MTRKPRPDDRKDRERAESDLNSSLMVEAAAGTGKTTLLVSRILNLIRTGNARPEEIVAITFTDRAAAELRAKLQERLGEASAAASGEEARRLAETLWGLDRMQVTTIHSFCTSILKERPIEAGIEPNFAVADELATSLLSEETWEEWIAGEMDRRNPIMARALTMGISLDAMHALALDISANRDVIEYLPQGEACDADITDFITNLRGAVAELDEARGQCTNPDDKILPVIEDLKKYARDLSAIDSEDRRQAYIFGGMALRSPRRVGQASNWVPKESLKTVREIISALRERLHQVRLAIAHETIALLTRELLAFVAAYTRAKTSRGLLDFHDLLLCTRDLLKEHPHVRDYFRRRFRYILVDEFQDTDPLQAEIIFYLAGKIPAGLDDWEKVEVMPGRLFLVGDPKQSIYRFRRADIEMYTSAKRLIGSDRNLSIYKNFRCADSIISVVNEVFKDLIKVPEDGQYQPEYVPLDFGRSPATLPEHHGIFLLYPPEAAVMDSADSSRVCEAQSIAAFIHSVTSTDEWRIWDRTEDRLRPLRLSDIGILMRNQTGLDILEDALRLYEIGYRVVRGKRFFSCEEIQNLMAVLMSVDNPNDRVSLVAALRSPFFGLSDEEIFTYHAEGGALSYFCPASGTPLEPAFSLLRKLHDLRNRVDAITLLEMLYEQTKATVVFLLRPNGDQRVANLLKIGDMSRALAERGLLTFRAFVRWLAERTDEEAEEAEAATVEIGDDFVRLLTIHKAKGLEFPVVILNDLASKPRKGDRLLVDRRSKDIAIKLGAKSLGIQTINYADLSEYENLRREAEERRMLYVAMTRARDLLVIPAYFTKGDPPAGSLLSYLTRNVPPPGAPEAGIKGMHVLDGASLDLSRAEPPPFRIAINPDAPESPGSKAAYDEFEEWNRRRASIIDQFSRGRRLRYATEDENIPAGSARGDGALFGRVVHAVLERTDWSRPGTVDEVASRAASLEGADASLADRAAAMVKQVLSSDLVRRVTSADRYYKEVPFAFKENGTIVEGVIDVVFEEGEAISVIDFKTDMVAEEELKERTDAYGNQMETYGKAITKACCKSPKEVILFFLHPMVAVTVPGGGAAA